MRIFILLSGLLLFLACTDTKPDYNSPDGYDLNRPIVYKMPPSLFEISGIAFHNGNSDTIYAEQDEEGAVYILEQKAGQAKVVGKTVFRDRGDFEDIAVTNDWVVMLRSEGELYTFPFQNVIVGANTGSERFADLLPAGEYESMYADNETNRIYVFCKDCKEDKQDKYKHNTGYIFSLNEKGELKNTDKFKVSAEKIAEKAGLKKVVFKPSAMTYNPWTKEWYFLSSINKMIVATDTNWKVKEVYRLDPKLYIQPEGMAFDKDRNLYISSEGSKAAPGTIFRFNYRKGL